ncbi:hypothetical protein B2J88_45255 [Rhodococcus sp. SRB_17]|nr:hypothetical protein [Rhodococcus sp. SRB_17]
MAIVIVVGGGPAGSAAAFSASKSGARVLLLERSGPNRDKACGDALVKEALPELREMGITDPSEISGETVVETLLEASDGTIWKKGHPGDCWIAPRTLLDQTLRGRAEEIGVEVRYRSTVLRVEHDPTGGFRVRTRQSERAMDLYADAVVLAHGINGKLSTEWGIDGLPQRVPAVSRYQSGTRPEGLRFRFDPENFGAGYVWEFPVGINALNVGIFSLGNTDMRQAMSKFDQLSGVADSESGERSRWRGAYEPLWTGKARDWTAANGGIISCGDAAGVVDPLTGEGIGPALLTGRLAGRAAAEYALGSAASSMDYSHWLYEWAEGKYDLHRGRRRLREQLNRTGLANV